jgi:hypothetical protein
MRKRFDIVRVIRILTVHQINGERAPMNLTRRTFLGLIGALGASLSAVTDRAPSRPLDAAASLNEPATVETVGSPDDYSAIVGVL